MFLHDKVEIYENYKFQQQLASIKSIFSHFYSKYNKYLQK